MEPRLLKLKQSFIMLLKWILATFLVCSSIGLSVVAPEWKFTDDLQTNWGQAVTTMPIPSSFNYSMDLYPPMPNISQMIIGLLGFQAQTVDSSPLGFDAIITVLNPTNFTLSISTYNNSQFKSIRFSSFAKSTGIDYLQFSYATVATFKNLSVGTGDRWEKINYVITSKAMNLSHKNMLIPYVRMFVIDRSKSMDLSLGVTLEIINETYYFANFTTNSDSQVLSASFCRILYDITAVQATQTTFIDTAFLIGNVGSAPPISFRGFTIKNIFFGANSFRLAASQVYSISILGWALKSPYIFLNISFVNYRQRVCPATNPYYIEASGSCADECVSGYMTNEFDMYCFACGLGCQTCTSMTECTQCSNGTGRTLVDGDCLCVGLVETNRSYCGQCSVTCATCSTAASNCLTCPVNSSRVFNSSTSSCDCLPGYIDSGKPACSTCSILFPGCVDCNASTCLTCDPSFQLVKGQCKCSSVVVDNKCMTCAGLVLDCVNCQTNCFNCTYLYKKDEKGHCLSVCGDGHKTQEEGCDDGNLIGGDGCSEVCQVEADYVCKTQEAYQASMCSYNASLKFVVKKQSKNYYKNEALIEVEIVPELEAFKGLDFSNSIIPNQNSISVNSVTYKQSDKTLDFTVSYDTSIQFTVVSFTLITPNSSRTFAIPPSNGSILIDPIDMPAYSYSQTIYTQLKALQFVNWATYALGLIVFIGAAVSGNPISVELMNVLQLSYFSMSKTAKVMHPLSASYKNLWFVNGYNNLQLLLKLQPQNTGSKYLTVLNRSPAAYQDFNVMFGLHILLLIGTLVCLLRRNKGEKQMDVYLKVRSVSRSVAMFNLMNLGYCLGLQIAYVQILSTIDMAIGFVITSLALFILYLPKILPDNEQNQQAIFVNKLRYIVHYHLIALSPVTCGFLIGLLHYTSKSMFVILTLQTLLFIYNSVFNPYKQAIQVARSIVNSFTGVWIATLPIIFWATNENIQKQEVSTHLCWVNIVVLMLTVFFNTVCFIRRIVVDKKEETEK